MVEGIYSLKLREMERLMETCRQQVLMGIHSPQYDQLSELVSGLHKEPALWDDPQVEEGMAFMDLLIIADAIVDDAAAPEGQGFLTIKSIDPTPTGFNAKVLIEDKRPRVREHLATPPKREWKPNMRTVDDLERALVDLKTALRYDLVTSRRPRSSDESELFGILTEILDKPGTEELLCKHDVKAFSAKRFLLWCIHEDFYKFQDPPRIAVKDCTKSKDPLGLVYALEIQPGAVDPPKPRIGTDVVFN